MQQLTAMGVMLLAYSVTNASIYNTNSTIIVCNTTILAIITIIITIIISEEDPFSCRLY